jgi:protein N-terminal glutamine amidohydrolase
MGPPRYHPFYCEENIWHLCRSGEVTEVVFITNPARRVALWHQKAAPPDRPIVWDYHVIAADGRDLWDLDSRLGCPIGRADYLEATFATVGLQPPEYDPRFAVVAAADFVRDFRSDRSHMRGPDGSWQAPPPPWPAIADSSNLDHYLTGATLTLDQLR